MSNPDITVLLATRNRARHLDACLSSIVQALSSTSRATEILVVDNGSNDETPEVLERFVDKQVNLRFVVDPIPGKSGAINRALREARGRVILFTDDDVHVPTSWIDDMAAPILEGRADAVCGRLVLAPHLDRPWLTPFLRSLLAELLDVSGDLPGMVGANMSASRDAAIAVQFDEGLGPGARGFDDDVLFNYRLKGGGYRLVGCTGPPAEHHLSIDRLTRASMLRLARQSGESHAYLDYVMFEGRPKWFLFKIAYLRTRLLLGSLLRRVEDGSIAESEFRTVQHISFLSELRKLNHGGP